MSYATISIGLFLFILAFFILNIPSPEPVQPTVAQQDIGQFCQIADQTNAPTFRAPPDNTTKTGSEDDESLGTPMITKDCKSKGPRHQFGNNLVTYRLVRKNVPLSKTEVKDHSENFNDEGCHFDSANKLNIDIPEVDKDKYKIFFPQIAGEISLDKPIFSRTRNRESDLMYFIDYGLIFLLHKNSDGAFTELKGGTTQGEAETFYLADVYQDIDSNRPDLPAEAFACDSTQGARATSGPRVVQPSQQISSDSAQLQLQYFVFGTGVNSGEVVNGWGIHCKPAVYLYPSKKQLVNVQVNPRGELSYTDPPYDKDRGWTVWAEPDGMLFSMNYGPITNNYLYYESKLLNSEIKKPQTGWVVKPTDMEDLFNKILPTLGLNSKEALDFKNYWLRKLPDSPYYFVGLVEKPQRDYLEALQITPNPDTSIRFSLYFEALDKPIEIKEPQIKTPQRNGFTVVDWGGMVKLHPGTPFTCSQ